MTPGGGFIHSPSPSPISSVRENDTECERLRRQSDSDRTAPNATSTTTDETPTPTTTNTAQTTSPSCGEMPVGPLPTQPPTQSSACPAPPPTASSLGSVRYAHRHGSVHTYSPYTRVSASHNLVGAGFVSQSMAIEPRFNQTNTVGAPPILTQMRHGPIQHSVIQTSSYSHHHHQMQGQPLQIPTAEGATTDGYPPTRINRINPHLPSAQVRTRNEAASAHPHAATGHAAAGVRSYYPQQLSLGRGPRVGGHVAGQRVHHHGLHPAAIHTPLQPSLIHTIRTPPSRPHLMAVRKIDYIKNVYLQKCAAAIILLNLLCRRSVLLLRILTVLSSFCQIIQ